MIGFALGYALPGCAGLPLLFYDPLARSFSVAVRPGPIPIAYYGLIGYGLLAALLCGMTATIATRLERTCSPRLIGLFSAWTLTALLLVLSYFAWNNWP